MRWLMSLVAVAGLGVVQAQASSGTVCERLARADDVVVEIRNDGIKAVIVNTSDRCAIRFADNLKTAPERKDEPPSLIFIRVEALDGTLLSKVMGGWYAYSGVEPYQIIDFSLTRLAPGETRVKHYGFRDMLYGIDRYLDAAGHKRLPWGSAVVLRVSLALYVDEAAAAGRVSDEAKRILIETAPVLHRLPRKPY